MRINRPETLPAGQCIEVNAVNANQCPVALGVTRSLSFDVTAHTSGTTLAWRRAASSSDVLIPSGGPISSSRTTTVLVSDIVLDNAVTIEIVDGDRVLIAFTLRQSLY